MGSSTKKVDCINKGYPFEIKARFLLKPCFFFLKKKGEGVIIYTKMSMRFWNLLQVSHHSDSMILMPRKQTDELLGRFGEHRYILQRVTRPSVDWDP